MSTARLQSLRDAPGTSREYETVYVLRPNTLNDGVAEVKETFLGDKQLAGSQKLVPVDNAAQQADFTAKVLGTDVAKYGARWTKKAFREGLTAPPVKGSDAEVLAFVKATPGAVGYVGASGPGVKVLMKY